MKAVSYKHYGGPEVLGFEEQPTPVPKDNEVLVKVHATSVTAGDQRARSLNLPRGYGLIGRLVFGLFAPRQQVLGSEFAGRIIAVGKKVTRFAVGDDVFAYPGARFGGYAEYATLPEDAALARMPDQLSYKEAVGLSFGPATALNFLRDKGGIKAGEKVLIVGASGGVGSAAVQLAKHFGADVTGVTSTGNVELVRSIGADKVIDYTQEDVLQSGMLYDIILDTTGTLDYQAAQEALRAEGRFLMVSGDLPQFLSMLLTRKTDGKKGIGGYAPESADELEFIAGLVTAGQFRPVIDRCYALDEIQTAHAYVDTGRKKGNVIITVGAGD